MFIPLEFVLGLFTALGGGFTIGYYVGKNQNPTITEYPNTLCPDMKEHLPDNKEWSHCALILHNGKMASVVCNWISDKKCALTSHKCRFLRL